MAWMKHSGLDVSLSEEVSRSAAAEGAARGRRGAHHAGTKDPDSVSASAVGRKRKVEKKSEPV